MLVGGGYRWMGDGQGEGSVLYVTEGGGGDGKEANRKGEDGQEGDGKGMGRG